MPAMLEAYFDDGLTRREVNRLSTMIAEQYGQIRSIHIRYNGTERVLFRKGTAQLLTHPRFPCAGDDCPYCEQYLDRFENTGDPLLDFTLPYDTTCKSASAVKENTMRSFNETVHNSPANRTAYLDCTPTERSSSFDGYVTMRSGLTQVNLDQTLNGMDMVSAIEETALPDDDDDDSDGQHNAETPAPQTEIAETVEKSPHTELHDHHESSGVEISMSVEPPHDTEKEEEEEEEVLPAADDAMDTEAPFDPMDHSAPDAIFDEVRASSPNNSSGYQGSGFDPDELNDIASPSGSASPNSSVRHSKEGVDQAVVKDEQFSFEPFNLSARAEGNSCFEVSMKGIFPERELSGLMHQLLAERTLQVADFPEMAALLNQDDLENGFDEQNDDRDGEPEKPESDDHGFDDDSFDDCHGESGDVPLNEAIEAAQRGDYIQQSMISAAAQTNPVDQSQQTPTGPTQRQFADRLKGIACSVEACRKQRTKFKSVRQVLEHLLGRHAKCSLPKKIPKIWRCEASKRCRFTSFYRHNLLAHTRTRHPQAGTKVVPTREQWHPSALLAVRDAARHYFPAIENRVEKYLVWMIKSGQVDVDPNHPLPS